MNKPARYFPIDKGIFEIAPGLRPFGTDFGNGDLDKKLFQIDSEFSKYRDNKINCANEDLSKYFNTHNLNPELRKSICFFISKTLAADYPQHFKFSFYESGAWDLECFLTKEFLSFDSTGILNSAKSRTPAIDGLDALATQIQEDFALLQQTDLGENFLSALHVCSPAHWSPGSKIGKDFTSVHAPIPGIEKINSAAKHFTEAMVKKGPFVRFVWGFATDNRLNHHPEPPLGISLEAWHGRKFVDPSQSDFFLRVERQVTWGFADLNAALFTIRISFWEGQEIKKDPIKSELLLSALKGMRPEILKYKGLAGSIDPLVSWLSGP